MQRRHFELIAETLCSVRRDTAPYRRDVIDHVAKVFAIKLAVENERFDRARFLKACGVEE